MNVRITLAEIPEGSDEPAVDSYDNPLIVRLILGGLWVSTYMVSTGQTVTEHYDDDAWTKIEVTR